MPVTTSLRQLRLEKPTDDERPRSADELRLRGLLVVSSATSTSLVAVDDVLELLVALLSNLPYRAFGQEINVRRVAGHPADIEVSLTTLTGIHTPVARMPHEDWFAAVLGMVKQAFTTLSATGHQRLIQPLMAVLGDDPART